MRQIKFETVLSHLLSNCQNTCCNANGLLYQPMVYLQHGPAFIFPMNQQPAVAPNRATPTSKSTPAAASAAPVAGSGGHSSATTMNFSYAGFSQNDAQYMAILQNGAYPFPIAAPPAYRGASPAQGMPFFNGPFYSPQMVPSQQQQQQLIQQLQQQHQQQHQQQQQQQLRQQQQQVNPSTSSGSSSSHKQAQQPQRVAGTGPPAASNSNTMHLRDSKDNPSTADSSKASQAQKSLYGQNFFVPQNFALVSGGSHSENKQPGAHQQQLQATKVELTPSQVQAYTMSFASFGGSSAGAVPSFDISAIVQNPALIQTLPDLAKHGFQIPAAAAAVAAQHKKGHNEDGKSGGDPGTSIANAAAEGKNTAASGTGDGKNGGQHHSLSFARPDNEPTVPNFTSILGGGNHLILNGGRPSIPPPSSAPSSTSAPSATVAPSSHQQQQLIQFQKQQQQKMIQLQQQLHQHQQLQIQQQQNSSRAVKSSSANTTTATNVSSPSMAVRFPQGSLAGFPPSVHSPQWKASARAASTSASASSAASSSSSAKNQTPQQQQNQQPHLTSNPHQTQISFGVTPSKSNNSVTGNSGSPRASPSSKPGQQQPTLPLQQQQAKNSPTITNANNRSITSILGHPHTNKLSPHQPQKQPQLFFSTPYNIQAQTSQPSKAGYYQQQQHQHQHQQNSSGSGMLSLSSSSLAPDPTKASAKGLMTSMAPHALMATTFPYSNTMSSSVSVKPEQKQSITGNDRSSLSLQLAHI